MFPNVVALFDIDHEKEYEKFCKEDAVMENRKRVIISPSVHGTTLVVNYDAANSLLNAFLSAFDVWNGYGDFKLSGDHVHCEVWFEMDFDFYSLSKCDTLRKAIERFGVEVEHDYHARD